MDSLQLGVSLLVGGAAGIGFIFGYHAMKKRAEKTIGKFTQLAVHSSTVMTTVAVELLSSKGSMSRDEAMLLYIRNCNANGTQLTLIPGTKEPQNGSDTTTH